MYPPDSMGKRHDCNAVQFLGTFDTLIESLQLPIDPYKRVVDDIEHSWSGEHDIHKQRMGVWTIVGNCKNPSVHFCDFAGFTPWAWTKLHETPNRSGCPIYQFWTIHQCEYTPSILLDMRNGFRTPVVAFDIRQEIFLGPELEFVTQTNPPRYCC